MALPSCCPPACTGFAGTSCFLNPSAPAEQLISQQVLEFQYQISLRARLQQCLVDMASRIQPSGNIGMLQVWRKVPSAQPLDVLQQQLYVDPELFLAGEQCLAPFRLASCETTQYGHQGMPGRVLKSGCVQVVQNLRIIPDVLHPRSRLTDSVADEVGEVVYVPVYDTKRPRAGPAAVLEALLSARAADPMLVANFISAAGAALSALQLSLSNPLPQPVRRSRLEGRKPRPTHPDSSPNLQEQVVAPTVAVVQASRQKPQQHAVACCHSIEEAAAAPQCCDVGAQQESSPATPGLSGASVERHSSDVSNSSAASTGWAIPVCSGASGEESADGSGLSSEVAVNSVLSSKLGYTVLPPTHCVESNAKQQLLLVGVEQPKKRAQLAGGSMENRADGVSVRPSKMQRTLSLCRAKSVPLGLDQVLLQAGAVTVATEGEAQPAASC